VAHLFNTKFLDLVENDFYYYDKKAAEDSVNFFRLGLVHVNGEWAGKPFILEPWQEKVTRDVYGWKRRSDGTRRFRLVYVEVPRKNGKSTWGAGVALKGLVADNEPRAEVYSAAGDRDQARVIFDLARDMVTESPRLSGLLQPYQYSIYNPKTKGFYKVLSADAKGKFGSNPHTILFDELFVQPDERLWVALTTGTGTRRQPLVWAITTAGWDKLSLCYEQHDHANQVLEGVLTDDELYPVIFAAQPEADWTDPKVWALANPSLGRTLKIDYLRTECRRAQESVNKQNTFRRFHLNQWTEQETRWMDVDDWKRCARPNLAIELKGQRCFGGLDLSTRIDLTALSLVFPCGNKVKKLSFFWCPEQTIQKRARKDRVPYDAWAREGFLRTTRGNVVDYEQVRADIVKEILPKYGLVKLGIDDWNATQIATQLEGDGVPVALMRQGFKTLSEPMKEVEKHVVSGTLEHDGNPIMTWMVRNTAPSKDAAGNIKPDKELSRERIDGVSAMCMAMGLLIREPVVKASVYGKDRGIFTI
jgi:phage terminase large subunit-like protein